MPEKGSAGFTLVEMLVALFLLSLVGLTLAHFQAFTVGAARALTERDAAGVAADNVAIDLLLAPRGERMRERASGSSENGGVRYAWSATLAPITQTGTHGLSLVRLSLHPQARPGLQVTRTFLRPEKEPAEREKEARQ